ncbi:hypothetical protein FOCC_FOCC003479 [Frankliniella occidentalis]|uniref:Innexin n=1 Tax=Frankliniella occidentalis TaxID=133901 RepID=A0A6J1SWZ3_FRAOC|nr:innexin inx2-like [Frankliniella occidentalis]KAE8749739.1 hypothetical protein FOCC_FOCC003479 [Frankliniella occidentalis]
MFDVFKPAKELIKIKPDSVRIDNYVFKLHYQATFIILLAFSLLVTAKQFVGDPIACIVEEKGAVPQVVMDTFCWISSTFTIPNLNNGRVGTDVIQPGVASHTDQDEVKFHKYYQWVCIALFFQSILFYVPRYIWKICEGGRMKTLALNLNSPIVTEEVKRDRKKLLVDYFVSHFHQQNSYAFRFFICEALNLVNVVGQMHFMDLFLDGEFSTYGSDVVKFTEMDFEERSDPMSRVFPKVTKCTFHKFGPSGSLQTIDSLCVLPLNVVNEKIYVFLWFWFVLLSIVTSLMIVYRMCVICFMKMRTYLLYSRYCLGSFEEIEIITKKCQIGDWFILYQLSRNIDPLIFKELISELSEKLKDKQRRDAYLKNAEKLEDKQHEDCFIKNKHIIFV